MRPSLSRLKPKLSCPEPNATSTNRETRESFSFATKIDIFLKTQSFSQKVTSVLQMSILSLTLPNKTWNFMLISNLVLKLKNAYPEKL
jgi:hypothetical protein